MKKTFAGILAATVLTAACVGFAACGEETGDKYTVYTPDGAPALSLVKAMAEQEETFAFHVVAPASISATVTYKDSAKNADFCVLPVNLASKFLGEGTSYQMLGTVTNGNFFFLTTGEGQALTPDNFASALTGKKVGVVQLGNVPGLTFQSVLKDANLAYTVLDGVQEEGNATKVNLVNMGTDASNVTPAFGCDYYLCPEPAVSLKVAGTANNPADKKFTLAGSLQELYGGENGYPQAVLVAKKSVIEGDKKAVETLVSCVEGSASYLANAETATVLSLLAKYRPSDLSPAFNEKNLTKAVIENCSVKFTKSADCKTRVVDFLAKLKAINANAVNAVADDFFYMG